MSNEERKPEPVEPGPADSWTLDDAPLVSETPEERLSRELDETANGMTTSLNDLSEELEPRPPVGVDSETFATPAQTPAPEPAVLSADMPASTGEPPPSSYALPPAEPYGSGAGTTPPTRTYTPEGSDDDRLMSALAWLSMVILQLPIVSIIQLLSPVNKERAFQRHHAVTSLLFFAVAIVYEIIAGIAFTILTIVTAGCGAFCLWIIFFVPHVLGLYYAYQAYMGKRVELPGLSDFGRKQGWM